MRVHDLKTWPSPFAAVLDGRKKFEFRYDDRGFAVGDILVLKEWDPTPHIFSEARGFTGREIKVRVTYLLAGSFGIPFSHVVMSIETIEEEKKS